MWFPGSWGSGQKIMTFFAHVVPMSAKYASRFVCARLSASSDRSGTMMCASPVETSSTGKAASKSASSSPRTGASREAGSCERNSGSTWRIR
jgi:hypothetical protein